MNTIMHAVVALFALFFETGIPQKWEWTYSDKHTFEGYEYPYYDVDGTMMVLSMNIEITVHKQYEEKMRALQRLMDIIEFLPDATFVIDQDKKVIAWNKAIEEMTGIKKEHDRKEGLCRAFLWGSAAPAD